MQVHPYDYPKITFILQFLNQRRDERESNLKALQVFLMLVIANVRFVRSFVFVRDYIF